MSIILNGTAGVTYPDSVLQASGVPAPSTSGNVLTSNGTTWTSAAAPVSSGGATQTTTGSNITLTSSSNRVQEITPTANITITLPNATTLSKGYPIFTITNASSSSYSISIALPSGPTIYVVGGGTGVGLSLTNNSTSDGQWEVNFLPLLTTQGTYTAIDTTNDCRNAYSYAIGYNATYIQNIALSSTAVMTIYAKTTGIYAVVGTISGTTITYGTPTLITATIGATYAGFGAVGLSSTNVLVWASRTSTTPVAYGLTVSGTSITVSTVSAGIGAAPFYVASISRIDNTTALIGLYPDAPGATFAYNTLTHNGASAPTLGTQSATIPSTSIYNNFVPPASIPLTSTTTLVGYTGKTTNYWTVRVVTTSGTSAPTLGTALATTLTVGSGTNYAAAVIPYSSTEVGMFIGNSTPLMTFTISGTTVTEQSKTDLVGYTGLYLPSWGTTTTSLVNNYGTFVKLTYTAGGTISKSGISTSANSGYSAYLAGNLVALDSTKYYGTIIPTNNIGLYGAVWTLI